MRPLRSALPPGLFELTTRATGNALLLRPSPEVNATILGVIGRAQSMYDVDLHAFVFLSSHYHMLLSAPSAKVLSAFLQFVNGNIARKLNILNDRDGAAWERRFRAIPVAPDRITQRWRLRYILAHGVKEGLVGRVEDWPGVSSLPFLRDGARLIGVWQDRTGLYHERRRVKKKAKPEDFEMEVELRMTVLPAWRNRPQSEWRQMVRELIDEVQAEAAAKLEAGGRAPLGREAVLATDPMTRVRSRRGRAPTVLALDRKVARAMKQALRALTALWREAAQAAMATLTGDPATTLPLPAMFWRALQLAT